VPLIALLPLTGMAQRNDTSGRENEKSNRSEPKHTFKTFLCT
jgi:hypothetical protein